MIETILSQKMIFVVGNSRSGTTMMGRILGKNSQVFTFGELHFFEQLWDPSSSSVISRAERIHLAARLFAIQREGYLVHGNLNKYIDEAQTVVADLPHPCSPLLVYAFVLKYEANRQGKNIPCDKTPRNVLFLDEILTHFPNSYVINMIRDPRDVLLSQKNKWRRRYLGAKNIPIGEALRSWANYHPVTMGFIWNAAVRAGLKFIEHPRVVQINFNEFLVEPEKHLKLICTRTGLPYSSEMLNVPQVGSSHGMDQPDRSGVNPEIAERWRTSRTSDWSDLVIMQIICRETMQAIGYQAEVIRANPVKIGLLWLIWPIKAGFALFFNLGRSRNMFSSVRRRILKKS
jgi:hypothetical protein